MSSRYSSKFDKDVVTLFAERLADDKVLAAYLGNSDSDGFRQCVSKGNHTG